MSANVTPCFGLTPNIGFARLNVAQAASRDGSVPSGISVAFTAGPNGSRVDKITVTSAQTTAAANSVMVVRIFIGSNAITAYRLYKEIYMATSTASNTAIGAYTPYTLPGGLWLAPNQTIGACISVFAGAQDQFDVIVEGIDY